MKQTASFSHGFESHWANSISQVEPAKPKSKANNNEGRYRTILVEEIRLQWWIYKIVFFQSLPKGHEQMKSPGTSIHIPPFWHGLSRHSSTFSSQVGPSQPENKEIWRLAQIWWYFEEILPSVHSQWNVAPNPSMHFPPFKHFLSSVILQTETSISQSLPWKIRKKMLHKEPYLYIDESVKTLKCLKSIVMV